MIKGSCCCRAVTFEIAEQPSMMGTCHCSRCRKVGASTFVFVKSSAFKLLTGREAITEYVPEDEFQYHRCFCGICGTALGEMLSKEDSFPIPANALDDDPGVRNKFHEFVADKPDWLVIGDDAKQFDGHPVSN